MPKRRMEAKKPGIPIQKVKESKILGSNAKLNLKTGSEVFKHL